MWKAGSLKLPHVYLRGRMRPRVFTYQLVGSFFCMWTTVAKWHLIKCRLSLHEDRKPPYYNRSTSVNYSNTNSLTVPTVLPVSALYCFPKIHTGSEVSGKSSNSPNRSVSYVKVAAERGAESTVGMCESTEETFVVAVLLTTNHLVRLITVRLSASRDGAPISCLRRIPIIFWKVLQYIHL